MSYEPDHRIDELLIKYLLHECTAEEIQQVENWLSQSADNQFHFEQIKKIWNESKTLSEIPIPDTHDSWERLRTRMKPQSKFHVHRFIYYAAASVLLFGILFFINKKNTDTPIEKENIVKVTPTPPRTVSADKEIKIDTLSDKSIVTLNKNASLTCPVMFDSNERRVALKGEAFFNITPNKQKPFYIDAANDVEIRVVGTSFNVKSFDAYTEVIVETGIVEVRKFNRVILLHPKEKARIDKEDSTIVVEKNKDKLYKYFRNKQFECDNTPLWKVVEVLNEAYGDSVVIANDEIKKLSLTASFDNESLESILEIISETFDVKIEKKGSKYILK